MNMKRYDYSNDAALIQEVFKKCCRKDILGIWQHGGCTKNMVSAFREGKEFKGF